jgi:hypothetical protein
MVGEGVGWWGRGWGGGGGDWVVGEGMGWWGRGGGGGGGEGVVGEGGTLIAHHHEGVKLLVEYV